MNRCTPTMAGRLSAASSIPFLVLFACNGGSTDTETTTETTTTDTGDVAEWEESLQIESNGALLAAWGAESSAVFAVGGNPDDGVIFRYDGGAWTEEQLDASVPLLNWVDGSGGDIWVVGNEGVALRRVGDGWEQLDAPTEEPLWGVWSASSDDVWAVGGDPLTSDVGVMLHFDGVEWLPVELPALDRPLDALYKVWGTSADHVFAVGEAGVILYYDGDTWTQQASGTTKPLISLWGNRPDNIVAVGGRSIATIVRYDGEGWTEGTVDVEPGLNGVWMDSDGYAYVCGQFGRVGVIEPGALTYESQTVSGFVLHGSFGFDGGPYFAVGGSLNANAPYDGTAVVRAN